MPSLDSNWKRVHATIARAAARGGRPAGDVLLVAVTKSASPELAAELRRLGQADLGESRVDELERKVEHFRAAGLSARWHFVGHLQRNKARRVVRVADVIQSVDSIALLETLARIAREEGRRPEVFLEVKLAPDPAKSGFDPSEISPAIERAGALPELDLRGLMTIAPLVEPDRQDAAARSAFERLAGLARAVEADPSARAHFCDGRVRTSMGMSTDFEIAIAAGSDVVRVGSALFAGLASPATRDGGAR